jgi:transposase
MEVKGQKMNFSRETLLQAVSDVEKGLSRQEVCKKYGMAYITLCGWINRYASKDYKETMKPHFNVKKRKEIVRAVQSGKLTIEQANQLYKIKGPDTIKRWIRAEKKGSVLQENTHQTGKVEQTDLQKALAEAQLKIRALETLIDVAEESLKIKIRKKPGAKQ